MLLTLQNPTFVVIRAKYFLLCDVSARGPVSRITTYDLPFPPTERSKPSYLLHRTAVACHILTKLHRSAQRSCSIRETVKKIQELLIPVKGGTQRKRQPFRYFNISTSCENKTWEKIESFTTELGQTKTSRGNRCYLKKQPSDLLKIQRMHRHLHQN